MAELSPQKKSTDEKLAEAPAPPHDWEDPALNTYELVKAKFEKQCFKVKVPFCYARIKPGYPPYFHSHTNLKHYYCDWKYWGPNKKGKIVKQSFIHAWLDDPKKRVVDKIIVEDPTGKCQNVYEFTAGVNHFSSYRNGLCINNSTMGSCASSWKRAGNRSKKFMHKFKYNTENAAPKQEPVEACRPLSPLLE